MCTVTVVPHASGVRLLCNRDERRARSTALPPRVHDLGEMDAIFPVDPEGTGTWLGCNAAGLAVALLNAHTARRAGDGPTRSRGLIVRELLRRPSLAQAVTHAARLDPRDFAAFQVVILQGRRVAVVASDSVSIAQRASEIVNAPLLFTSSSLGDGLVTPPRRRLFDRLVLWASHGWLAGQARFHDHQWTARPEISIRMERADALTVSRTAVDLTGEGCELRYEAPVRRPERVQCCLPR
jgi:hypothetical protein